jgi:hypothetical protein
VDGERVPDLLHDRHGRVERGVGVLEDHLQVGAQLAELPLRRPHHLVARVPDAAGGRAHQPQQRPSERRLAAARLADHAENLALADVEADAVDGTHHAGVAAQQPRQAAAAQLVVDLEVVDGDQRLGVPGRDGLRLRPRRHR